MKYYQPILMIYGLSYNLKNTRRMIDIREPVLFTEISIKKLYVWYFKTDFPINISVMSLGNDYWDSVVQSANLSHSHFFLLKNQLVEELISWNFCEQILRLHGKK